ncbi:Uncharacterized protein C2A9.02 [Hypsizygus marmoreus]|uniref:Uncharacterized protein C2A9.02 n=1 Tax=Hypsizygus marmoreus TaxID=39966 RepID=A0A369K1G9_HYPMA|nr:Uncharacterized protein C2A9.02 [Hypsizygus marmoreus]
MSPKTNILLIGATGHIGGSVLLRFLERSDAASLSITTITRSSEKAGKLRTLGVNVVVGSYSDFPLLEKLASEADVIIDIGDSDDLPAARATLRGTEKRFKATGVAPILIHTSGTGVLSDNAAGMYAYETIYDDANPEQIETLAPTQFHRNIDLELINADKQGYVKTYLVIPSMIYGIASGRLVELGIQNRQSFQIPLLICMSLDRGQGGMVGEGKNLWPNVHIDDVADLYVVLYDAIISNPATGHGREGIYFAENGEISLYDVGVAISKVLVELGRGKSAEPTPFTEEEVDKYFAGIPYFGSNSRCVATRSRSIGWQPTRTTADLFASIKPETEDLLKQSIDDWIQQARQRLVTALDLNVVAALVEPVSAP